MENKGIKIILTSSLPEKVKLEGLPMVVNVTQAAVDKLREISKTGYSLQMPDSLKDKQM